MSTFNERKIAVTERFLSKVLIVIGGALLSTSSCFAAENAKQGENQPPVIPSLKKLFPAIEVNSVESTPVNTLDEITFGDGQSVYSLKGTNYIIRGELLRVTDEGLVNITEEGKSGKRRMLLDSLNPKDMIVFSPAKEKKAEITVFTDTDCGYCRKLHQEVPELNAMGVEVRYLAFPRGGIASRTYTDLSSAWCSEDKRDALSKLKNSLPIPKMTCDNNPVAAQYQLGNAMGVTATPATVLADGQLLMGYRSASDWKKLLGL